MFEQVLEGETLLTVASFPLKAGYYRTGSDSDDLRRCPDAGANSGCVGGVRGGEGPCKPSLQGPYCKLCEVRDALHGEVGEPGEEVRGERQHVLLGQEDRPRRRFLKCQHVCC